MLTQEKYIQRLLLNNLRSDGRQPLQSRQYNAQFLPKAGTLLFNLGSTSAIIKVKAEITAPRNQRPSEGVVFFKVDCQACQGSFQQNRKLSAELVRLLQTVVVGSKALDPESLCILSGRYIWKIVVEINVITDEGNLIDCILNGVVLALLDMRKPLIKLEQSQISIESTVKQPLSLAHLPLSFTFSLFQNNIFADPSGGEERVAKSRVTVSMNVYKQLCSIHKPGGMGISQTSLSNCVQVVEQQVKKLNEWMRNIAKVRPIIQLL